MRVSGTYVSVPICGACEERVLSDFYFSVAGCLTWLSVSFVYFSGFVTTGAKSFVDFLLATFLFQRSSCSSHHQHHRSFIMSC